MSPCQSHQLKFVSMYRSGFVAHRNFLVFVAMILNGGGAQAATVDLLTSESGIYRTQFSELALHGFVEAPTAALRMENQGQIVPIWVNDGGDGQFGQGDWLEFVADKLHGANTFHNPHTPYNVYKLSVNGAIPGKFAETGDYREVAGTGAITPDKLAYRTIHMEDDTIRVRFKGNMNPRSRNRDKSDREVWYWSRLSILDKKPYEIPISIASAETRPDTPVSLEIAFRGWSHQARGRNRKAARIHVDHIVEVLWNDVRVGVAKWSGQERYILEIPRIPVGLLRRGKNTLALRVPKDSGEIGAAPRVDVSLLNWVKLKYAFDGRLDNGQTTVDLTAEKHLSLAPRSTNIVIRTREGHRFEIPGTAHAASFVFPDATGPVYLASGNDYYRPSVIRRDFPSRLRSTQNGADYLMISHGSLFQASRPLAEYRGSKGLRVSHIDVQDIYDEFNGGIVSPAAIKRFITFAAESWKKPSPRFVLLVGDASWDGKNTAPNDGNYSDWTFRSYEARSNRFGKNASTAYAELNMFRNLIPVLYAHTNEGHAASDNAYVTLDPESWKPQLAIGRIPVASPREVKDVVDKIISYESNQEVGPWRRNVLWVTNEKRNMQRQTDALISTAPSMSSTRIYPALNEKNNEKHQQSLLNALGEGQLLVHFLGHGGRYIWRTGAPDLKKNHDLFTLEHLDQLQPTNRLPLVMSMTCYSAPFDHPTADSIGEKFLRVPKRGAIGVLAASWRNVPRKKFSETLLAELAVPGQTIGEAIARAKRKSGHRLMVETYNYLGDPATTLKQPTGRIRVKDEFDGVNSIVSALVPDKLGVPGSRARVDWLDGNGNVFESTEIDISVPSLSIGIDNEDNSTYPAAVRIYAWNSSLGVDALGYLEL